TISPTRLSLHDALPISAINAVAGRDHWPTGYSAVIGGGGFSSGLVIGETDPEGKKTDPVDPIEIHDLYATIFKTLGVEYDKEMRSEEHTSELQSRENVV